MINAYMVRLSEFSKRLTAHVASAKIDDNQSETLTG
jgi:hypothetical protein